MLKDKKEIKDKKIGKEDKGLHFFKKDVIAYVKKSKRQLIRSNKNLP